VTQPRSGGGVSAALRFLGAARSDPALRERLSQLAPDEGLEGLQRLAVDAGYRLSADDLRAAHAQDWGLRRMRYARETERPPAPRPPPPS